MDAVYQHDLIGDNFPYNIFQTDLFEFPPHWHEDIEVILNLDEPFDLGLRDNVYTLDQGDIMVVSSKEVHYFLAQAEPRKRLILQFKSRLMHQDRSNKHHIFTQPLIKTNHPNYNVFRDIMMAIKQEESAKIDGYEYMIMSKIYELITNLLRHLDIALVSTDDINSQQKKLNKLTSVFDYVMSNYQKDIDLDNIAQVAGYSSYYFTRFFKESTGMTFMNYLNHYRISKAIEELLINDSSILEISLNAGFKSIKTFNRVFKNLKGCSPTEYKNAISDQQLSNFVEIFNC